MNEVPGARERPGRTKIQIDQGNGETAIYAPAQGLTAPMIVLGLADVVGLIVFCVALALFIMERHSFFGVRDLLPADKTPTQHWKWLIVAGWVGLIIGGSWVLLYIARLGYQSQELRFSAKGLVWTRRTIGRVLPKSFRFDQVASFFLSHDAQGVRPSRLLLILSPLNADMPAEEEYSLFENTTEEEKEWLESVCSVLFARYHGAGG